MQTCYNCGEQVDDNVLICPKCGALVKRYGPPVRQAEADAEPSVTEGKAAVLSDGNGRLRLRTAIKVLLILDIVVSLYTALSFACVLAVYNDQDFYFGIWQQMPQLSAVTDTLALLMESVRAYYIVYLLFPVFLAVKAGTEIWFLCSKRRTAFAASAGAAGLVFVISLPLGGILTAIVNTAAMLFSWVLLKKDWNRLPN